MNLQTKFDINQEVNIKAIATKAVVTKIELDGKNLYYEVAYWFEGNLRFVKLDEGEMISVPSKT